MDEMELGASLTDNGFVFAGRRRFIRQEVLHVHASPGALEDDRAVHESSMPAPLGLQNSVSLRRSVARRRPGQTASRSQTHQRRSMSHGGALGAI